MHACACRAVTIREIVIVIICLIVTAAVLLTINRSSQGRRGVAKRLKDQARLTALHKSFITQASEFQGILPTPGLVNRLPVEGFGRIPGRGAEDITQNTTANLFSLCIMANYFTPEICVGPTEPSSRVKEFSGPNGYNFAAYNPTANAYWDTNFQADLHVLSHVSYAHMPISGKRGTRMWRDIVDANMPILGNRGPLGGVHDPNSITNKIHPPFNTWTGVIVFSDNHSELTTVFPTVPRNDGGYRIAPECLPKGKTPPKMDAAITFTKQMTEQGPIVQHD